MNASELKTRMEYVSMEVTGCGGRGIGEGLTSQHYILNVSDAGAAVALRCYCCRLQFTGHLSYFTRNFKII